MSPPRRFRVLRAVLLPALLPVLVGSPGTGRAAQGASSLAAPVAAAGGPLSPRNASYDIDVVYDPAARTLDGRQVLTWRNIREAATDEMRFHLYWNAWRNSRSTWMLEDRLRQRSDRGDDIRPEDWGAIDVSRILLLGPDSPVDLAAGARFAAPDDGNPDDRTVLIVPMPRPVAPGETVQVEMDWHARIPRTFARTGYQGDFVFIAHWFPKLGVWEGTGWNCHQYHAATEYFSDYGVYDVRITVPEDYVVGATGRRTQRAENADGTVTHTYRQEDVHAFSWTASRHFQEVEAMFDEPGLPPVSMRLLIQPEHRRQAERHLDATRAALKHYGSWYGPYPYGHVTIVDPAWGSGAGGMEYPTLFTCGTRLFNPRGGDAPESVTVHEAGHQFWYGVVGNNEFEHAWLDEGLNTFSTLRTLDAAYGPRVLVRRFLEPPGEAGRGRSAFLPFRYTDIEVPRYLERLGRYRRSAASDRPSTPTFRYHPGTAGDISYSKTALWLATLERYLGWDRLQPAMSTFYRRHAFAHPTPEEFFAVLAEVTGENLDWFVEQVHEDAAVFDYAVDSVDSSPVELRGLVDGPDGPRLAPEPDGDPETWRTEVVVRRLGDGVFPVDVLLVFEDGSRVRESWDGQERWKLWVEERPAKLAWAEVDPDRVLMLDVNPVNNTLQREPAPALPAAKWASKWALWFQDLMSAYAFFI